MSTKEEMNFKNQVLLENYKIVSTEIYIYLKEKMRCFLYASILMALYFGVGIEKEAELLQKLRSYIPFGFLILIVYYLGISYWCMALMQYRASIEQKINKLYGKPLITLDSYITDKIHRYGFLQIGEKKFAKIPSPQFFLGIIASSILFIMLIGIELPKESSIKFVLLGICFLLAIYVFFLFPKLVRKEIHNIEQSIENSKIE